MEPLGTKTVVLGLGNTIRSDDGVGVLALEKLQHDPRIPAGVEMVEGGTKGLELSCYASEASKLLVLDAVDIGEPPGTLVRFDRSDLTGLPGGKSVHQLGLADLLATLSLVAIQPQEIVLLGVQPATTDWGTALSPAVAAVLPLVEAALAQLPRWAQLPSAAFEEAFSGTTARPLPTVPGNVCDNADTHSWLQESSLWCSASAPGALR
jgi:hydrogenase maturation protease